MKKDKKISKNLIEIQLSKDLLLIENLTPNSQINN